MSGTITPPAAPTIAAFYAEILAVTAEWRTARQVYCRALAGHDVGQHLLHRLDEVHA